MGLIVHNVAFDCADPYELAQFWSRLMERPVSAEDFPGDPEASVQIGPEFNLWFNQVPEGRFGEPRTDRSIIQCGEQLHA